MRSSITWPREELRRILFEYGEERYAPLIAAAIERTRSEHPIKTTLELASVIRGAMPPQALREKQHPAKRSSQAIRIAVNDELNCVSRMMKTAVDRLDTGGRLCGHHVPFVRGPHCEKRIPWRRPQRAVSARRAFRYVSAAESRVLRS